MHTVAIFKNIAELHEAARALKDRRIPTDSSAEPLDSDESLYLLLADDTETELALAALDQLSPRGRLTCPKCGSGDLDFPGTPNHTMLSRAIGHLAIKTSLIEKQLLCEDCRHQW